MKRTALAAVVVAALVFGVVGYAVAADKSGDVAVTATVNPAFSITIGTPTIDFTGVDIGGTESDTSVITVKSNKAWEFSKSTDVVAPLAAVLTEETSVSIGAGKAKGVTPITATYTLDLTGDAAYDLEGGTPYTATYTYTATQ